MDQAGASRLALGNGGSAVRLKAVELIVLFTVAAAVLWDGARLASRYKEHLRAAEAGGYEILLGALLSALAILYWRREESTLWVGGRGERHVAFAFGILAVYTLAMPHLGYLLSTGLAVTAYVRILGGYGWAPSLIFACVLSISSAWLWARIAIMLPQGVLPWP